MDWFLYVWNLFFGILHFLLVWNVESARILPVSKTIHQSKTMKLLSANNTKIKKGEKLGWKTLGLSLAPHTISGKNLCPHASEGCALACLNTAGMGVFSSLAFCTLEKTPMPAVFRQANAQPSEA